MRSLCLNIFLCIGILSILQSCQKESQGPFVPSPVPTADTTWYPTDTAPPVTLSIDKPVYIDSFNCNDDDGAKIFIGDSAFFVFPGGGCMTVPDKDSSTIRSKNAKIRTQISILTSKGDIIRHRISTVSNGHLLEFGAHISIKLLYRNKPVYWNSNLAKQIQVKIRVNNYKPSSTLQYYKFQPLQNDTVWLPVDNNPLVSVTPGYVGLGNMNKPPNGYFFNTNTVGIFGCDNLLQLNAPTTRLNVFLPLNYTNKNTLVYAVFNDSKTVVRLKSYPQGKTYGIDGIPQGINMTLLSISKIDNNYYLGTEVIKTKDSTPFSFTPNLTDLQSLDQYLSSL